MKKNQDASRILQILDEPPSKFPVENYEGWKVLGGKTLYRGAWLLAILLVRRISYGEEELVLRLQKWERNEGEWKTNQRYNIPEDKNYLKYIVAAVNAFANVEDPYDLLDEESISEKQDLRDQISLLKRRIERKNKALKEQKADREREISEKRKSRIKDMKSKVDEFKTLIQDEEKEKEYQDFLKENVWFFGAQYYQVDEEVLVGRTGRNDFLIERIDEFHDIVELKKPSHSLFQKRTSWKMSSKLRDALCQMSKYLHTYNNEYLYHKEQLEQNINNPKGIIVIGRRGKNIGENLRQLERVIDSNVQIKTYDDLVKTAKNTVESYEEKGEK